MQVSFPNTKRKVTGAGYRCLKQQPARKAFGASGLGLCVSVVWAMLKNLVVCNIFCLFLSQIRTFLSLLPPSSRSEELFTLHWSVIGALELL